MSKSTIALIVGVLILVLSVGYNFMIKQEFNKEQKNINRQLNEIEYINNLKRVWNSKGVKSKLENALKSLPSSKKSLNIKRSRAEITLKSLNSATLNNVLGKISSLPVDIRSLNIKKSGEFFGLECKCDW